MTSNVEKQLEEVKRLVAEFDGPATVKVNEQLLGHFQNLADNETMHKDLLCTFFGFLQSPKGEAPEEEMLDWHFQGPYRSLARIMNPANPLGIDLSLTALRNWFQAVNAMLITAQGSEGRLKMKYAMLAPLAAVLIAIPMHFPEFLPKAIDYIDNWSRRITFDSESIALLLAAYRGDGNALEDACGHATAQIASQYLLLRQESLQGRPVGIEEERGASGRAGGGLGGAAVRGGAGGGSEESNGGASTERNDVYILPNHLMSAMADLKAISEGSEPDPDMAHWYRTTIGTEMLEGIEESRKVLAKHFGAVLAKYKNAPPEHLRRNKGQIDVLLKRELERRSKLLTDELTLMATLDARHAYLVNVLNRHCAAVDALQTSG